MFENGKPQMGNVLQMMTGVINVVNPSLCRIYNLMKKYMIEKQQRYMSWQNLEVIR